MDRFAAGAAGRVCASNVRSTPRCGRSGLHDLGRLIAGGEVMARLPQSTKSCLRRSRVGRLQQPIPLHLAMHLLNLAIQLGEVFVGDHRE